MRPVAIVCGRRSSPRVEASFVPWSRRGLLVLGARQLPVDELVDFAGGIDIRTSGGGSSLSGHGGDSGGVFAEADPDLATESDARDDSFDDVIAGDLAIFLEDGDGGIMHRLHGQFVAALDGVLDEGDSGADVAFRGGVTSGCEGEHGCQGGAGQQFFQHGRDANRIGVGCKRCS